MMEVNMARLPHIIGAAVLTPVAIFTSSLVAYGLVAGVGLAATGIWLSPAQLLARQVDGLLHNQHEQVWITFITWSLMFMSWGLAVVVVWRPVLVRRQRHD